MIKLKVIKDTQPYAFESMVNEEIDKLEEQGFIICSIDIPRNSNEDFTAVIVYKATVSEKREIII